MSDPTNPDRRRQAMSALMDGELNSHDTTDLCRDWRDDAQLRVTWHAFHLIGDVMRSEDLAHSAAHDEAFLLALRQRLDREPVVLAPPATIAAPTVRRRQRWLAPAAVAAGFAAVAGVLVVMQMSTPVADGGGVVATAPVAPAPAGVVRVAGGAAPAPAANVATEGVLIRDAQLDRYLQAHKQYGPQAAMVPGGVVRSTATLAPQR
jgi:sigma-E factor negative regulatory protein RseA